MQGDGEVILGDNLEVLPGLRDEAFQLIYIDPPFNTGRAQTRRTLRTVPDEDGERTGFRAVATGRACSPSRPTATSSTTISRSSSRACAKPAGCWRRAGRFYFHIDYREAHYCKLLLDEIFGRECFLNEIIWAYDYGARAKRRWPAKHDTILVYVKDPSALLLRLRGGRSRALHGARARHRREGRARQAADRRLVAHDRPDQRPREDGLPDAEAGGHRAAHGAGLDPARATGAWTSSPAAARSAPWRRKLDRRYVLIDCNPEAVRVMRERLDLGPDDGVGPKGGPTGELQRARAAPFAA